MDAMHTRRKIFVVDDDPDIREQVAIIMKNQGHDVQVASGQEEALETLLSFIPDLAIIDLMMEHMDSGFVLCHHIKKLYPGTPVIILTAVQASTGLDFKAKSAEAASWVKADALMEKPIRAEQLTEAVNRFFPKSNETHA